MHNGERRSQERFLLRIPASVSLENSKDPASRCHVFTRDISAGGAFLYMPVQYAQGTRVDVNFSLPIPNPSLAIGLANVLTPGIVLRLEAEGIAIRFRGQHRISQVNLRDVAVLQLH